MNRAPLRGDLAITLTIDDVEHRLSCAPHDTLLTVLRREAIWSARYGSDTGETGAAGLLLDGRLVSADVVLAAQADGHRVTTVASLGGPNGELHPIQAAFMARKHNL